MSLLPIFRNFAVFSVRKVVRLPRMAPRPPYAISQRRFCKMSEVDKAQTAKNEEDTIFGKIARKEIPAKIIYEDEDLLAFHDVSPTAPTHFLVIPKLRIDMLENAKPEHAELLGKLLLGAAKVAKLLDLDDGYRVVINNGKHGCQSVFHLHLHIVGGRQLGWPPG